MPLTIDYRLTGTGWAECAVSDGASSCVVTASYLSDALRNLILAATAVVSYFTQVTFCFEEEPGEYRWVLTSPRPNEIELRILDFQSVWSMSPDSEGKLIFHTKCLPREFAEAALTAATKILTDLGESGYAKQWAMHPFPIAQLGELNRLLVASGDDA